MLDLVFMFSPTKEGNKVSPRIYKALYKFINLTSSDCHHWSKAGRRLI